MHTALGVELGFGMPGLGGKLGREASCWNLFVQKVVEGNQPEWELPSNHDVVKTLCWVRPQDSRLVARGSGHILFGIWFHHGTWSVGWIQLGQLRKPVLT